MFYVSVAYTILLLFTVLAERLRLRGGPPDFFTFFTFLFTLQLVVPGIYLTAAKAVSINPPDTGVEFFNIVLKSLNMEQALLALVLSYLFLISYYSTWLFLNSAIDLQSPRIKKISLVTSETRWQFIMLLAIISSTWLASKVGGYEGLINYRNNWNGNRGGFITANLFSLTGAFSIISIIGCLIFWNKKLSTKFFITITLVVLLSLMTVSRRSIGIAALLLIFTILIKNEKLQTKWLFITGLFFLPMIIYGKRILFLLGNSQALTLDAISRGAEGFSGNVLLFVVNIGTSLIESWATFLYLDLPLRYGTDHILSVARRIPDGILGLDLDFPPRMVRLSTEAFLGPEWADVPPGFIGQMWLDFGFFGPTICAMAFISLLSLLQLIYHHIEVDLPGLGIFIIFSWVICLPINTGSLDFTFSVDILFLIIFSLFMIKIKKNQVKK
jgi:hypothetical protein